MKILIVRKNIVVQNNFRIVVYFIIKKNLNQIVENREVVKVPLKIVEQIFKNINLSTDFDEKIEVV